jgi:hypothetical protein
MTTFLKPNFYTAFPAVLTLLFSVLASSQIHASALSEPTLYIDELSRQAPTTEPIVPSTEDASSALNEFYIPDNRYTRNIQGYVIDLIKLAYQMESKVIITTSDYQTGSLSHSKDERDAILNNSLNKRKQAIIDYLREENDEIDYSNTLEVRVSNENIKWGEDNKWLSSDGQSLFLPAYISNRAIRKTIFFTRVPDQAIEGVHSTGLDDTQDLVESAQTDFQGQVAMRQLQRGAESKPESFGVEKGNVNIMRVYSEGGNQLIGRLQDGTPYAIFGRDSLLMSTFYLIETYQSNPEVVPEFSRDKLKARFFQLLSNNISMRELDDTATKLIKVNEDQPDNEGIKITDSTDVKRSKALLFLTQMDVTKDIFAKEYGISRQYIAFVPQQAFHIDMFMRPMKPGTLLINDENENQTLLQEALFLGNDAEKLIFQKMLSRSEQRQRLLDPILVETRNAISHIEGLELVSFPGVFDTAKEKDEKRFKVNFMNSIVGNRSLGTKEYVYLTNHSSLVSLRNAFIAYMNTHYPDFAVRFLGSKIINRRNNEYSTAELNITFSNGGLDCIEIHR